jgi:hypothetical protein
MFIQILKHTPIWVFVLFVGLFAYGVSQRQTRLMSRYRLGMLPVVMLALSVTGVYSAFGLSLLVIVAWLAGLGLAVGTGLAFGSRRGVSYSSELDLFHVPGSWVPLLLMMLIFFTKYAVGISLARQLPFAQTAWFGDTISFVYGFLSGMFIARALIVRRSEK